MTQNTQTPAGWYPDPLGLPQLRWWDGRSWTEHTSDARLPLVAQDDADQVPLVETVVATEPAEEPVILQATRSDSRQAETVRSETVRSETAQAVPSAEDSPAAEATPSPRSAPAADAAPAYSIAPTFTPWFAGDPAATTASAAAAAAASANAAPAQAPSGSAGSEAFMQAAFAGMEGDVEAAFRAEASKLGWNLEEQFDQVFQEEVDRAATNLDAQFDAAFGGGSSATGLEAQFDAAFAGSAASTSAASASASSATAATAAPTTATRLDAGFDSLLGGGASSPAASSPAAAPASAFTAPGSEPDLNHFDAMFGTEPELVRQAPSFPTVPAPASPGGMPSAAADFGRIPAPTPVDSPRIDRERPGRSRSPWGDSLRKLFRRDS